MKKFWILLLVVLLLSGCRAQETFETVDDVYAEPAEIPAQQVILELPEDAAVPALESDTSGKLYLCDGYAVTVQTLEAGNLNGTIKEVTGFSRDTLDIISTSRAGVHRYECVWTAVGETGDQVGRAVILDDGNYHYAVCVMGDAGIAGDMSKTWNSILTSFSLADTAP